MKGALWAGLASFRLVADIKPLLSDLTLDEMRPSIQARREGALMVNYTDMHAHTHAHTLSDLLWIIWYKTLCIQLWTNASITQNMHTYTHNLDNGFYSHLAIWISAPSPLIKLELKQFFSVFVPVFKKKCLRETFSFSKPGIWAALGEQSQWGTVTSLYCFILLCPSFIVCCSSVFLLDNDFTLLKFPLIEASVTFELL